MARGWAAVVRGRVGEGWVVAAREVAMRGSGAEVMEAEVKVRGDVAMVAAEKASVAAARGMVMGLEGVAREEEGLVQAETAAVVGTWA